MRRPPLTRCLLPMIMALAGLGSDHAFAQVGDDDALYCGAALVAAQAEPRIPGDAEARLAVVERTCAAYRTAYPAGRSGLDPASLSASDAQYVRLLSEWAVLRVELGRDCRSALELLTEVAQALAELPSPAESFARAAHLALTCRVAPAETEGTAYLLEPGSPALRLDGLVVGSEDASWRFGGSCIGMIEAEPAAVFEVVAEEVVSVAAFAPSEADLGLVVTGPAGTWCNDDYYGRNPALEANLPAGRYEVFVGELFPSGYGTSFELLVAARPLAPVSTGGEPSAGVAEVVPGAAPTTLAHTSGGPVVALAFGPGCAGTIAEQPNHRLVVPEEGHVTARVTALDATDLTLVVAGPSGTWCNDDFDGTNPAVSEWMPAGTYDVYVGDHAGEHAPYQIRFSDENLHAIEAGRLTPQFGTATLSGVTPVVSLGGVAQGAEEARTRFGPPCTGFIGWEPNHTLYLDAEAPVWIDVSAMDGADLTLAVAGEAGTWCNDDARGRDPGLAGVLPAGTYDLYVGEFSPSALGTAYGLRVSLTERPEAVLPPSAPLVLAADHDRESFWGVTYGNVEGITFAPDCVGFVPSEPTQRFELPVASRVEVGARSGPFGDLVLVVRGPDGVFCNDDWNGLNPGITGDWSPGTWEVFVGEYNPELMGTPFGGWIEARPAGSFPLPPAGVEPPAVPPVTVPVALAGEVVYQTGASGGLLRGRSFGPSCVGFLPEVPNFDVTVTAAGLWELAVVGEGDTTLVVDGPGGPFCNDDADAFNPGMTVNLEAGTYRVYVGSYNPSFYHDFQISFRPASAVAPPGPTLAP